MAFSAEPDYERLESDKHLAVRLAPTSGATGIQNLAAPTEAEAAAMQNAAPSISWNDYGFGVQESERTTDPSLADESTYEDYGQINYGGEMSFYYPKDYDDDSNNHSLIYDMTDQPRTYLDVLTRLDGAKNNVSAPIADGDFVSTFRTITDAESDSDTGSEALRRTVGFLSQGAVAIETIVGAHTITAIEAPGGWASGTKARLRAKVQDRDYTNALQFTSSDAGVVRIFPGGFYEVTGTTGGTATITIRDEDAGTSQTVPVTVT